MPTYDYICKACGHALEIFHSMSEAAKRKCPECGKLKLERQIGAGAGILFKGDGYYETDYRSESYKKGAAAEKKAEKSSKDKPDTKPDSKPDSKKDTKKDKKEAS